MTRCECCQQWVDESQAEATDDEPCAEVWCAECLAGAGLVIEG